MLRCLPTPPLLCCAPLALFLGACATPSLPVAPPPTSPVAAERVAPTAARPQEAGEAELERHALHVFLGGSREIGDRDGYTAGIDYELRLARPFGVGAFADFVSGVDRSFAGGLVAYWHAGERLTLSLGPGMEDVRSEWSPILRLAAAYEFPLRDGWSVAPSLSYDIAEGDDYWVYGVDVGFAW